MIKGYMDRSSRKRRRWITVLLLIFSSLFFYYIYPTSNRPSFVLNIFLVAIVVSFVLPYTYYKVKTKDHIIWKRKKL